MSVLEQVKKEGFDNKRIEAAIHQMELGQKHASDIPLMHESGLWLTFVCILENG